MLVSTRLHRLMVRTSPSQGGNRGSNPLGVTIYTATAISSLRFFINLLKGVIHMNKPMHLGHRERVRERIEVGGIACLSDIELLEYILFFSIPRGDTNHLAHHLLDKFVTLEKVFEASKDELMTVEGIGEKSALLLSTFLPAFRRYQMNCLKPKKLEFNSTDKVLTFIKNECLGNQVEHSYAMYLNQSRRLIKLVPFSKGTYNKTQIFVDQVVKEAITLNARYVVVAHNHTAGTTYPSEADAETAVCIYNALQLIKKDLMDFVIVDHFDGFSFVQNGIITANGIIDIYKNPNSSKKSSPEVHTIVQDDDEF